MQVSKMQVWNMALGFIGTRNVASEDEVTPEAQQCALYWDAARRQALRDYPWNFAQRRVALAERPLPDAWAGEYRFAYALPSKCLKLHRVLRKDAVARPLCRVPFRLAHDTKGMTILLTMEDAACADYTIDVEDVSLWDDLFTGLMARRLACLIAIPLFKNNTQKIQELEQLYRAAIPPAYEASASEEVAKPMDDTWLLSRGW
ncbi:MAG: hypothetical protein E7022_05875 [Desulfovibrio desulfuricans]|nr:hypothetical protein [Desulfovibrio desulfuricans]